MRISKLMVLAVEHTARQLHISITHILMLQDNQNSQCKRNMSRAPCATENEAAPHFYLEMLPTHALLC